jgi:hypothetical protein
MESAMKTFKAYLIFFVAVVFLSSIGAAAEKAVNRFKADLGGRQVIPAVRTAARGEAVFHLGDSGKMEYTLTVHDIENVTAAHIHEGRKTRNGPPAVLLFTGPMKTGRFSGVLAEGTITPEKMVGPLKGKTVDSLVEMIKRGEAYVNVHTEKFPDGEIRGQIQ